MPLWRCASSSGQDPAVAAAAPALGGLVVGLLALISPQVMSSGHGALHFAGFVSIPLAVLATIFILKAIASVISLGSGFAADFFSPRCFWARLVAICSPVF